MIGEWVPPLDLLDQAKKFFRQGLSHKDRLSGRPKLMGRKSGVRSAAVGKSFVLGDGSQYDVISDGSFRLRGKKEAKARAKALKRKRSLAARARRKASGTDH